MIILIVSNYMIVIIDLVYYYILEQSSVGIPPEWIPMNGTNCVTVQLTQGSPEFNQVQTTFQNSIGRQPNIYRVGENRKTRSWLSLVYMLMLD